MPTAKKAAANSATAKKRAERFVWKPGDIKVIKKGKKQKGS